MYSVIGVDRSAKKQRAKRSKFLFNHQFVNNDLQFIVYKLQMPKGKRRSSGGRLIAYFRSQILLPSTALAQLVMELKIGGD